MIGIPQKTLAKVVIQMLLSIQALDLGKSMKLMKDFRLFMKTDPFAQVTKTQHTKPKSICFVINRRAMDGRFLSKQKIVNIPFSEGQSMHVENAKLMNYP